MLQRLLFWLGTALGGLAAFRSLAHPRAAPRDATRLPGFAGEAVILCDSAGVIIRSSDAAVKLFGLECAGYYALRYPNGQAIPPGQLPLTRVLRSGAAVTSISCLLKLASGVCVLDFTAQPLPGGGAAAVFRDTTALHECQIEGRQTQARHETLLRLTWRLRKAGSAPQIGQAVTEEVCTLLTDLPEAQVRLYSYDRSRQTLTLLAAEPPIRPKSAAVSFPFDAVDPALWQLYLDRQPSTLILPGEPAAASTLALPLLSGGLAAGHLSLACSQKDAFDAPGLRETLEIAVSMAALALAVPQSAVEAVAGRLQVEAVREVAQAVASQAGPGRLADLAADHVQRVIGAACTLAIADGGKLPLPLDATTRKAWRTQKRVTSLAVTALPIGPKLGVMTVCMDGTLPPTDAQMKFLETLAALLSLGLKPASETEAPAGA